MSSSSAAANSRYRRRQQGGGGGGGGGATAVAAAGGAAPTAPPQSPAAAAAAAAMAETDDEEAQIAMAMAISLSEAEAAKAELSPVAASISAMRDDHALHGRAVSSAHEEEEDVEARQLRYALELSKNGVNGDGAVEYNVRLPDPPEYGDGNAAAAAAAASGGVGPVVGADYGRLRYRGNRADGGDRKPRARTAAAAAPSSSNGQSYI
mmetsp:Transcript_17465/g.38184  ORF Transcript_17465/g.38184 Transcript_17465/m.38184 type:complete len:208 (+) Transcript_17465:61-684(+)